MFTLENLQRKNSKYLLMHFYNKEGKVIDSYPQPGQTYKDSRGRSYVVKPNFSVKRVAIIKCETE